MAAQSLKLSFNVETKDDLPKLLFPKIKIAGLDAEVYSNGSGSLHILKEAIMCKNEALRNLVENEQKLFEISFIKRDSKPNECFAVAKIDPSVRSLLKYTGNKLFVDLSSCKVSGHIHLTQCYKCQLFGHKKNSENCALKNKDTTVCLYCAENHLSKSCPHKANNEYDKYKCSNCAQHKNPAIRSKAEGHTTTSNNCTILQQEVKAVMNHTQGIGPCDSKNDLET